jgi:hypothetical protein
MNEENTKRSPLRIWPAVIVLVLLAAVVGFYYVVMLPSQGPGPAPTNSAGPAPEGHSDVSPDGTNCHNVYNLQEENRDSIAAPTIVDINEATGNLLVRGPLPLIVRDGTGNTNGCRNKADWTFAYDNLNGMLKNVKDVSPAYFSSGKAAALRAQMQSFDIADYHVIDISLLNTADNAAYVDIEKAAFGQQYSRCAQPVVPGTLHGQPANLIWSSVGACSDDASCQNVLNQDSDVLCSYNNLMDEINTLMTQKDPSGKKVLIYVHCTHGADRTGIVTMGYLMKDLGLGYTDALLYTDNLGQKTDNNPHNLAGTYLTMAQAYCKEIGCQTTAGAAATPGATPAPAPVVTTIVPVATLPVHTPVPTQTPVTRYNPAGSGGPAI